MHSDMLGERAGALRERCGRLDLRLPDSCASLGNLVAGSICCVLLCGVLFGHVAAQTRPRAGILREIQARLLQSQGVEVWEEARRSPNAEEAAPLMEHLAARTQDPTYAARAALWLGHYYYGAGQVEGALQYFIRAGAKGDNHAVKPEADFWAAQCRNLLGMTVDTHPTDEYADGQASLFKRLAELDGQLRTGDLDRALGGYLSLEGQARTARCLAPLYYRLGLVLHTGAGRGAFDASIMRGWTSSVSRSAERALVVAIGDATPKPRSGADSQAIDFKEPSSEAPANSDR